MIKTEPYIMTPAKEIYIRREVRKAIKKIAPQNKMIEAKVAIKKILEGFSKNEQNKILDSVKYHTTDIPDNDDINRRVSNMVNLLLKCAKLEMGGK